MLRSPVGIVWLRVLQFFVDMTSSSQVAFDIFFVNYARWISLGSILWGFLTLNVCLLPDVGFSRGLLSAVVAGLFLLYLGLLQPR